MFVGHIGAGLIAKRIEPRLNLGALLFAVLFADLLLWVLVICGVESVGTAEATGSGRFFTFEFPYSHGLLSTGLWSVLAAGAGWAFAGPEAPRRRRLAWAAGLAVFSHFALDFLVHVPDLPVLGSDSPRLGLGLWRHMPLALAVELLIAGAALVVYLRTARLSRARTLLACGMVAVAAALTAVGPYIPGEPPPAAALAMSSLATLMLFVLLGFAVEGRVGVMAGGSR